MSTSRWLAWTPDDSTMGNTSRTELPKPTEASFGGSVGAVSGLPPIISTSPTFTQSHETPTPKERTAARVLVLGWLRARCTQSWQAWGSEKSLWYDYCAWCEQHKQLGCRREVFCETMNESFTRQHDGWQGIVLAIDFREAKYVM
jgi:hypothetical protein